MTSNINNAKCGEDPEGLRKLFVGAQQGLGGNICLQNCESEFAGLPEVYAKPHGCLLLARFSETNEVAAAVGLCAASIPGPNGFRICKMKRLCVVSTARGRSWGKRWLRRVSILQRNRDIRPCGFYSEINPRIELGGDGYIRCFDEFSVTESPITPLSDGNLTGFKD